MKTNNLENKLKDALVELLKKKSLQELSVAELLRHAKVPKSTFYRSYDGMDNLIESIEAKLLDSFRDLAKYFISSNMCMSPTDENNEYVQRLFEYIYDNRAIYLALMSPNGDLRFEYKHNQLIREFFGGKIAFEGFKSDYPEFYMRFALAGHNEILKYWLTSRPDISPKEMAMLTQNLMYGLYLKKEK